MTALYNPLATELARRYYAAYLGAAPKAAQRSALIAVVDLSQPVQAIKANIRKSYKSLINWGMRNLYIDTLDSANASRERFDTVREFHIAVAGRETRSAETWQIQADMIAAGEAFCTLAYLNARLVAANLILLADAAYYGVGVYERELMAEGKPLAHAPLYCAILRAKRAGLKTFVLGEVDPSGEAKRDGIAHFKRGFATSTEPADWIDVEAA